MLIKELSMILGCRDFIGRQQSWCHTTKMRYLSCIDLLLNNIPIKMLSGKELAYLDLSHVYQII